MPISRSVDDESILFSDFFSRSINRRMSPQICFYFATCRTMSPAGFQLLVVIGVGRRSPVGASQKSQRPFGDRFILVLKQIGAMIKLIQLEIQITKFATLVNRLESWLRVFILGGAISVLRTCHIGSTRGTKQCQKDDWHIGEVHVIAIPGALVNDLSPNCDFGTAHLSPLPPTLIPFNIVFRVQTLVLQDCGTFTVKRTQSSNLRSSSFLAVHLFVTRKRVTQQTLF